ncbi:MAG: Ig-like domain-containing protein [Planctomycetota bacterium]
MNPLHPSSSIRTIKSAVRIRNPGWTCAQVRDRLYSTARPVAALASTTAIGGVANMFDALDGGVLPAKAAPSASISSPGNGATFAEGDSVSFSGSASDAEDGNISGSLSWTSSLDGAIGSGGTFSTSLLSVGTHSITASVSDSGGLSDSDSITVTIDAETPPVTDRPTVANLGGGSVRATWNDLATEDSYQVQYQERVGSS